MKTMNLLKRAGLLFCMAVLIGAAVSNVRAETDAPIDITLVNSYPISTWTPPSPDPTGMEYNPNDGYLYISDSEVDEIPGLWANANIFISDLSGNLIRTCDVSSYSNEPHGISVHPDTGDIYIVDDVDDMVYHIALGGDGIFCTADDAVTSFSTMPFGGSDLESITFGDGKMILSTGQAQGGTVPVYVIDPGADVVYGNADDVVTSFDVAPMGMQNAEGVTYYESRNTLFFVSSQNNKIIETTLTGQFLKIWSTFAFNTVNPSDITIMPGTYPADQVNVLVTARGIDNGVDPNENDGMVFEFNLILGPQFIYPFHVYLPYASR